MVDYTGYSPDDGPDDVEALIDPNALPEGYYWLRLQDTTSGDIEDIPISGADVVFWWTLGLGRCDCVRGKAYNKIRGQEHRPVLPCGHSRMRLLGIWDRGGRQLHPGES